MKKDILKELVGASAHIGHQRRYRTPQLRKYIFKVFNKIDIINLDITMEQVNLVKELLSNKISEDVLVVSNRKILIDVKPEKEIVVIKKWKPGYISNIKYGKLKNLPKIIIVDKAAYQKNLINEAKKAGILIIGLCDTNTCSNVLKKIDYPIIINDDSDKAVELLIDYIL